MLKNKSLLLACIAAFLFFAFASIKKPFVMDEVYFVNAAIGESKDAFITNMVHPPLYQYMMMGFFKIFGINEINARIVGILFALATIVLIYLISLEVFRDNEKKHLIALSGSFIYSINPFIIQNSTLVSIDSTLLPMLIMLFMFVFMKTINKDKRLLILGLLFGLLLWAKFSTPVFMMFGIFLFYVVNKEYKKGIIDCATIVLIGASIFLITWTIYSKIFDMPFWVPIEYNINTLMYRVHRGEGIFALLKALWGIRTLFFWITPFFSILIAYILYQRSKHFLIFKKSSCSDILLLCGSLIVIVYSIIFPLAYGFPHYITPAIPLFSILIGELVVSSDIMKIIKERYIQCFACLGIIWAYLFYVVKDPIIFPWKQEYDVFMFLYNNYLSSFITFLVYKTIIYVLPVLIFFIMFLIFRFDRSKLVVISLIFALISTSIYIDAVQSQADYSTAFNYGETGLRETASYVSNHTNKSDFIISDLDIGYYAGRRYYNPFEISHCGESDFTICQKQFEKILDSNNITYLVFRSDVLWKKDVNEYLNSKFTLVSRVGSFEVYAKK